MDTYDPVIFGSLPEVDIAAVKLKSHGGEDLINNGIKDLLHKHGVTDSFGVALVHRHFDLKPDEIMVECRGVATPWSSSGLERYARVGKVLPLSWVIVEGRLHPYEFFFSTDSANMTVDVPEGFVSEYGALVKSQGLDGVLGIRALRKEDDEVSGSVACDVLMEFTERYATFTVPLDTEEVKNTAGNLYQTSWSFTSAGNTPSKCNHRPRPTICSHVPY